jgi:DNA-directed RNA polymerase subunit alpha
MARKNLLQGFKRPKDIVSFEHGELNSYHGKFTAAPFEPGFGTTVGNTLRRVLLSSIQSYAITAVRITTTDASGKQTTVSSEFDTIPNIVEDTIEVINNLKQVRLKLVNDADIETVEYNFSGKCEVTSDDFAKSGKVEVLNQGFHIMSLNEGANFLMELNIELGRGYVPSETNSQYIEIIGTIPIDAIFSPVKKVKYTVEPVRIGQRSDYDKLNLEIWTDGTVRPEDALAEAAKIAKEHFQVFINFDETAVVAEVDMEEIDEKINQLLNMSVDELELTVRSKNGLEFDNIRTIGDLVKRGENDLIKIPNFGKRSLQEIKEKLEEWNLSLGVTNLSELKEAVRNVKFLKDDSDET